jgi:hypothetical protein
MDWMWLERINRAEVFLEFIEGRRVTNKTMDVPSDAIFGEMTERGKEVGYCGLS